MKNYIDILQHIVDNGEMQKATKSIRTIGFFGIVGFGSRKFSLTKGGSFQRNSEQTRHLELEWEAIRLVQEDLKVADDATSFVYNHVDIFNGSRVNLLESIPELVNEIDFYCSHKGFADIENVKKTHHLEGDLFEQYYSQVCELIKYVEEAKQDFPEKSDLKKVLEEIKSFVLNEETTLIPYVGEQLQKYKNNLLRKYNQLLSAFSQPTTCKQILNSGFESYYRTQSDRIKSLVARQLERYKYANDRIQKAHEVLYQDFFETPVADLYFSNLNEKLEPCDDFPVKIIQSWVQGDTVSDGGSKIDVTPYFDYVIVRRTIENYDKTGLLKVPEYRDLFDMRFDKVERLKCDVAKQLESILTILCKDDPESLKLVSRLVVDFADTTVPGTWSQLMWKKIMKNDKKDYRCVIEGQSICNRPILVLIGYLASPEIQLIKQKQIIIANEITSYQLFENNTNQDKNYSAINQGYRGSCLVQGLEDYVLQLIGSNQSSIMAVTEDMSGNYCSSVAS